MLTYKQAKFLHIEQLCNMGWTISDMQLKVPYATSPCGHYRLWYKPQAVHYTTGVGHAFKDARAVMQFGLDIRITPVDKIIDLVCGTR